jgi:hypothetical protein
VLLSQVDKPRWELDLAEVLEVLDSTRVGLDFWGRRFETEAQLEYLIGLEADLQWLEGRVRDLTLGSPDVEICQTCGVGFNFWGGRQLCYRCRKL